MGIRGSKFIHIHVYIKTITTAKSTNIERSGMHHIAIISIRPSTAQPMPTYRTMYAYALRQPPAYTTPTATLTAAEAATTPMEELSFLRATTDTAHSAHHDRGPRLPSLYGDDEPGRRVVVNVGCVHSRDGGRHVDHAHHDHHVHGHGHGLGGIMYGDAEKEVRVGKKRQIIRILGRFLPARRHRQVDADHICRCYN